MTDEERATATALLERLPLFEGCTRDEIEQLAAHAEPVDFKPGEKLCVSGSESRECYVVADGKAVVMVGNVTVAEVGAVDVVGERGPINRRPRAATVTADTPVHAYAISREQLHELMRTSPTAAATMRDELLRRYG